MQLRFKTNNNATGDKVMSMICDIMMSSEKKCEVIRNYKLDGTIPNTFIVRGNKKVIERIQKQFKTK